MLLIYFSIFRGSPIASSARRRSWKGEIWTRTDGKAGGKS